MSLSVFSPFSDNCSSGDPGSKSRLLVTFVYLQTNFFYLTEISSLTLKHSRYTILYIPLFIMFFYQEVSRYFCLVFYGESRNTFLRHPFLGEGVLIRKDRRYPVSHRTGMTVNLSLDPLQRIHIPSPLQETRVTQSHEKSQPRKREEDVYGGQPCSLRESGEYFYFHNLSVNLGRINPQIQNFRLPTSVIVNWIVLCYNYYLKTSRGHFL